MLLHRLSLAVCLAAQRQRSHPRLALLDPLIRQRRRSKISQHFRLVTLARILALPARQLLVHQTTPQVRAVVCLAQSLLVPRAQAPASALASPIHRLSHQPRRVSVRKTTRRARAGVSLAPSPQAARYLATQPLARHNQARLVPRHCLASRRRSLHSPQRVACLAVMHPSPLFRLDLRRRLPPPALQTLRPLVVVVSLVRVNLRHLRDPRSLVRVSLRRRRTLARVYLVRRSL